MTIQLNLIQKLIEVRKAVPYLKKDNSGHQFKYVSSSQTLGALKAAMDAQCVLLVPSVEAYEIRDHTTKNGGHEYFTHLMMKFTWINADDPADTLVSGWCGQGLDSGEKGIGKAQTYAEKYFLLKFFNIPTDKDDPDSFQEKRGAAPAPPTPAQIADELMTAINECKNLPKLGAVWADDRFQAGLKGLSADQVSMVTDCKDMVKKSLEEPVVNEQRGIFQDDNMEGMP